MIDWLLDIHTRSDDSLRLRRSRALAMLTIVLVSISLVVVVVDPIITHTLTGAAINLTAAAFFVVVFLINRSGRLTLAISFILLN